MIKLLCSQIISKEVEDYAKEIIQSSIEALSQEENTKKAKAVDEELLDEVDSSLFQQLCAKHYRHHQKVNKWYRRETRNCQNVGKKLQLYQVLLMKKNQRWIKVFPRGFLIERRKA